MFSWSTWPCDKFAKEMRSKAATSSGPKSEPLITWLRGKPPKFFKSGELLQWEMLPSRLVVLMRFARDGGVRPRVDGIVSSPGHF